jgi:23S rRNA pseudouridine1911/1915/1917 synthase
MAPLPLTVLFQDADMLVVDKPSGMHTAPLRPNEAGTLLERVIASFPEVARLPGVKKVEPGLVHRLDHDTSGLVVVARNAEAFASLREQFTSGRARKSYLAACEAIVDESAAAEDGPLRIESRFAPYGSGRKMVRVVLAEERRRHDLTRELYTTEATIIARAPGRALLLARIAKGFRHQVRAHLSFLGYPILGDLLYGAPVPAGAAARMYLHASKIEMEHPGTNNGFSVSSPMPAEFDALFKGASV